MCFIWSKGMALMSLLIFNLGFDLGGEIGGGKSICVIAYWNSCWPSLKVCSEMQLSLVFRSIWYGLLFRLASMNGFILGWFGGPEVHSFLFLVCLFQLSMQLNTLLHVTLCNIVPWIVLLCLLKFSYFIHFSQMLHMANSGWVLPTFVVLLFFNLLWLIK